MANAKKEEKTEVATSNQDFELDDLGNPILDADGNPIPKKKKSKKKLIIIGAVALLAIGGGAAAMLTGGDKEAPAEKAAKTEAHGAEAAEPALDEHGNPISDAPVYMDLPDITANLNSTSRRTHYLNLKVTLELSSDKDVPVVEENLPRIIDTLNIYLRELRQEDLQGTAGVMRLEKEIMVRLDKTLKKGMVKDILFRDILVQ